MKKKRLSQLRGERLERLAELWQVKHMGGNPLCRSSKEQAEKFAHAITLVSNVIASWAPEKGCLRSWLNRRAFLATRETKARREAERALRMIYQCASADGDLSLSIEERRDIVEALSGFNLIDRTKQETDQLCLKMIHPPLDKVKHLQYQSPEEVLMNEWAKATGHAHPRAWSFASWKASALFWHDISQVELLTETHSDNFLRLPPKALKEMVGEVIKKFESEATDGRLSVPATRFEEMKLAAKRLGLTN